MRHTPETLNVKASRGKRVNSNKPLLFFLYQKRCPHRLITASLAVSRQMLHSNVLSWLLLSAEVELLDPVPGAGFSGVAAAAAAAAEPEAGGAAAVAIERTDPLKKKGSVGLTPRLPSSSTHGHKKKPGARVGVRVKRGEDDDTPKLEK